jgi:xylulokinase
MEDRLVIGHDAGTSGDKAVLATVEGEIVASEFAPYPIHYLRPQCVEQDPEDWWNAVSLTSRRLIEKTGTDPEKVKGIAFSSQMLGVVPVDKDGEPLCAGIIWMDCRAEEQAVRLVRKLGGRRVLLNVVGAVPSGKDVVCKLKWIHEEEPNLFDRTKYFLDVKSYLVYRSTGVFETDQTGASVTGFTSRKTRDWSKGMGKWLGAPVDKMPPVHRSTDIVGGLQPWAAEAMGLKDGTPVVSGMGDAPAAAIGSGVLSHGECAISLGTSGLLLIIVDKPVNLGKNGMFSTAAADPTKWLVIGEMNTVGGSLDWWAENMATAAEREAPGGVYKAMDSAVASVEPGSGKLFFMPWLYGERSPVSETTLRGGFANLNMYHGRDEMLRSIYEGVAFNFRWQLEAAKAKGLDCKVVRAIGGGAGSDQWMQIFADATGRTMEAVENERDAGALGAALAVPLALGIYDEYSDIKGVVKVRKKFTPDRDNARLYDACYSDFKYLYERISPFCKRVNSGT